MAWQGADQGKAFRGRVGLQGMAWQGCTTGAHEHDAEPVPARSRQPAGKTVTQTSSSDWRSGSCCDFHFRTVMPVVFFELVRQMLHTGIPQFPGNFAEGELLVGQPFLNLFNFQADVILLDGVVGYLRKKYDSGSDTRFQGRPTRTPIACVAACHRPGCRYMPAQRL